MRPVDLDALVGRDLRQLPLPRAPHTLLPRVLAAVQAWSTRPWYSREWFTWPLGWQIGSVALLMTILAGGAMVLPAARDAASAAASEFASGLMTDVPQIVDRVQVASNIAQVLWRAMVQPFLAYALVLVGLMFLVCATGAVALDRALFGRALQS